MGHLSGRAPGLCWSAPPENSPPAKGVFDWSQNLNSAKFHTPPPQTVAELEILRSFAGGAAGCVSVVCALIVGALGLFPPAFEVCASPLPPFHSPAHRPVSAPLLPCASSVGFVLPRSELRRITTLPIVKGRKKTCKQLFSTLIP